jgi:hypothetical protein
MAGLRSVWVPLRGLWDPSPPMGRNPRPPCPAFAPRCDPNPRWPRDPAGAARFRPSDGAIRGRVSRSWDRAPRARARGGQGEETLRDPDKSGARERGRKQAPFFRGASDMEKGLASNPAKPFIQLVEPTGIESVTYTIPFYRFV